MVTDFFIGGFMDYLKLEEIQVTCYAENKTISVVRENKLNVDFYVSGQIFNECPFIVGSNFQEFSKGVVIDRSGIRAFWTNKDESAEWDTLKTIGKLSSFIYTKDGIKVK